MKKSKSDIFNYNFDWYNPKKKKSFTHDLKDECCEKYKKKGEKHCKNCPTK